MATPFVALVGRPNVGKSTLFNRIVGERISVVDNLPGTTRDRIYEQTNWNGASFTLVDTGGIEPLEALRDKGVKPLAEGSKDFVHEIREQAEAAIDDADVVIFAVDAQTGLTATDEAVAGIIRRLIGQRQKAGKHVPPILVAASKAEARGPRENVVEFYKLGFGDVYPVSGMQGDGVGDLLDEIVKLLPERRDDDALDDSVKIAIVGRPNVGKSSLFNKLIGEPRVIVSTVAGTTRDSIDTVIEFSELLPDEMKPIVDPFGKVVIAVDGNRVVVSPTVRRATTKITLIDTAGIRKRGTIEPGVEKFSVLRAFKAIDRADVVFLLIDAADGVTSQDEHIAGFVLEAHKGVVVIVNKWDLIESEEKVDRVAKAIPGYGALTEKMQATVVQTRDRFNFMSFVPVLFASAVTGFRVDQVLPTALRVNEAREMRISTSDLNRILREASDKHAPPVQNGRRMKIFFGTQVAINPPTFVIHCNDSKLAHFTYRRFIENQLRDEYGFMGAPIRVIFRGSADRG